MALYYSCSSGLEDIGEHYIIHVPVVWLILESFILFMFQWFGGYLKGFILCMFEWFGGYWIKLYNSCFSGMEDIG